MEVCFGDFCNRVSFKKQTDKSETNLIQLQFAKKKKKKKKKAITQVTKFIALTIIMNRNFQAFFFNFAKQVVCQ